jgi:hypothetical protein
MQQNVTPGGPFISICKAPPIKKEYKWPQTTKENKNLVKQENKT